MSAMMAHSMSHTFSEAHVVEDFEEVFLVGEISISRKVTILVYYSFTTLSTVGFGDYHPISDSERIIQSLLLLVGVASFTYIINSFMSIVVLYENISLNFEDKAQLSKFIGFLRKFNEDLELDLEIKI